MVVYRFPMDFDRLRYLAAVARTGSVRAAAGALGVTPGAVSKGIARLEEEAGVQLLTPRGRGVALTDEGEWLARRAEHLVAEHASLGNDLAARRSREPELCCATYDVFATWLPGLLARQFLPGVPLSIRERWPGEVESAVATGLSDLGITFIPVATDGVVHVEVARVPLGIFTRRGAFRGVPSLELPFVVPSHPVTGAVGQYGPLDGWPPDAPLRDVRFRASSLEARLELCRQDQAATLLPNFVAAMHNARTRPALALEQRPDVAAAGRLRRRVYVVQRSGSGQQLHAHVEAVSAAVRAVCDGGLDPGT